MIRRGVLLLAFLLVLFAAGCGGKDEEGEAAGEACGPALAAMSGTPSLPSGFPMVEGVVYTGQEQTGPSTIVKGYRPGELEDTYDEYKNEIGDASGYSVTKSEKEEDDAEVNYEGGGSTGQVKLIQRCADRTSIAITVRPA